jgi:hypothetical protein
MSEGELSGSDGSGVACFNSEVRQTPNAAVNVNIQGSKETVGVAFQVDLNAYRIMFMVEQCYLFSKQGNGGFIKLGIQRDRSVVGDFSPGAFAEIVFETFGGGSDAFHVVGKATQGRLSRGTMGTLMVDVADPVVQLLVQ